MIRRSGRTTRRHLPCAALAATLAGPALASEDYDLRYAPGIGGADMSAPFEGGWVFQAPAYVYSGSVKSTATATTDLTQAPFGLPIPGAAATTSITSRTQLDVYGLLPRLSFMTSTKFLGATVGGTAMIPLIGKRAAAVVKNVATTVDAPGLPAANAQAIAGLIDAAATGTADLLAGANTNTAWGLGDLEMAPILRWAGDTSQVLFIPTVVFPTGDYQGSRAANPSAGNFYTFRPAVQYSLIGDGWDFGTRLSYSINTRNDTTGYRTGNVLDVDAALLKSFGDALRIGVVGYAVDQTTRDTSHHVASAADLTPGGMALLAREAPTLGQTGHVVALGPEIAWIKGAGEYLLDGRIMKEFSAVNRPEGLTAIVTLSKPF